MKVYCALKFNDGLVWLECVRQGIENNTENVPTKSQPLADRFVASSHQFDLVISTDVFDSDVYLTLKKVNKAAVEISSQKLSCLNLSIIFCFVSSRIEIKIEFSVSFRKIKRHSLRDVSVLRYCIACDFSL